MGVLDEPETPVGEAPLTPIPAAHATRRGIATSSVLAAAMFAVGEILEPEKASVEIHEEAPKDLLDPPGALDLDFGNLPDL